MTMKIGIRFIIDGPLHSYHQSNHQSNQEAYQDYKKRIRNLATEAGVPLKIPSTKYADVKVVFYWKGKPHVDLSNAWKAIEDALFRQDRNVHKIKLRIFENTPHERAIIRVRIRSRARRNFASRILELMVQMEKVDPRKPIPHSTLLRTSRMTGKQFQMGIFALHKQNLISIRKIYNCRGRVYSLISSPNGE